MIEINNLTTNPVDEEFLKKIGQKVLAGEKKKEADLSIALVGQGRIRELNKKYRGKNRVTDVLAFPESKVLLEKFKVGPKQEISGLGEIVICLREVKKNVKRFALPSQVLPGKTWEGEAFKKELARVLIHGILHLLGYEHERTEEEAKKMEEKENYYLSEIFPKEAGFIILVLDVLFVIILIAIIIFSLLGNKAILADISSTLRK